MMNKIKVRQAQNMLDLALEQYGSIAGVVKLCLDNKLHLGEELLPERELIIDESFVSDKKILTYIQKQQIIINTGV